MIDVKKLARLTGIHIPEEQIPDMKSNLEKVVSMLDVIKNTDIPTQTESWHSLLWLQSIPSQRQEHKDNSLALLKNVQHPVTGNTIEIKSFSS